MRKKKNALGYTYLAPALISILLVTCLPIIYTVILSFTNYNMYHLNDYSYVGWENYRTVFSGSIKSVFLRPYCLYLDDFLQKALQENLSCILSLSEKLLLLL